MRRGNLMSSAALVCMLLSLLASMASIALAQDGREPGVLRVNWGDWFPDTLDPQLSHSGQWAISGGLDWEGLTRIDEELQVIPGAAESWEFSPDGTTITFHLRDSLVFSDGVPVTAEHFRYAMERLCGPDLDSASAYHLLYDVVGCEALFNAGDDDAAIAAARASFGARVLDEQTLEITMEKPAPYFPVTAAIWGTIPLREELIEAGGPEWWANPEFRVGNGPFRLVEYVAEGDDRRLLYARNDRYWNGPTKLDRLEFHFLDYRDEATMEAYRRGELDVNWPTEESMPAIEADPMLSQDILVAPVAGTDYLTFNLAREPFTDKKVREAFAYAFDREGWCQEIQYGACTPVLSMVSPGAPGAIETDAFAFDPVKARAALAASTYGGPDNLPEVTWYIGKGDVDSMRDAEWLTAQFHQVLGIELQVEELSEDEFDVMYGSDDPADWPQLDGAVWWADPDPRDWFVIWRCNSEFGNTYCNPELDALLDRADSELNPVKRIALYEAAGHLLVADAPAIFLHQSFGQVLVKPYVTGYSRTASNGNWPGWTNLLTVNVEG